MQRDKGKEKVDLDDQAVAAFTHPDHDERLFETWYSPDTIKYLVHSSPNDGKYLRVVFDDHEDDLIGFKEQLQQLIMLSNKLDRPALFICKEPGCPNHWMCGMTVGNRLFIMNPVGITQHQDFYKTLGVCVQQQIIQDVFYRL